MKYSFSSFRGNFDSLFCILVFKLFVKLNLFSSPEKFSRWYFLPIFSLSPLSTPNHNVPWSWKSLKLLSYTLLSRVLFFNQYILIPMLVPKSIVCISSYGTVYQALMAPSSLHTQTKAYHHDFFFLSVFVCSHCSITWTKYIYYVTNGV